MEKPIQVVVRARALLGDDQRLVMCWSKAHQVFFLPGGTLEPGEAVQACLVRELREEMALETVPIQGFLGCL